MRALRSPNVVWLLLVAATLLSYASWAEGALAPNRAGSAVLVIAFLKARLIGIRFMELHEAVLPLRLAFETWVVVVCTVLLVMFGMTA
jgi:membrane-bound ClpP family serine protease